MYFDFVENYPQSMAHETKFATKEKSQCKLYLVFSLRCECNQVGPVSIGLFGSKNKERGFESSVMLKNFNGSVLKATQVQYARS